MKNLENAQEPKTNPLIVQLLYACRIANQQRLKWANLFLQKDNKGCWNEQELKEQQITLDPDLSVEAWTKKYASDLKSTIEAKISFKVKTQPERDKLLSEVMSAVKDWTEK